MPQAITITTPFPIFTDTEGNPLEDGYVYIGTENLNPLTNPISVYWDEALSIPAVQPIRTIAGYASRSGAPGQLYVAGVNYSMLVQNKNGSLVWSSLSGTGISPNADGVEFLQAGVGAVARSVQAKLREIVSVKDFGAVGDAITDDTAAIQAALDAAEITTRKVHIPRGRYLFTQLAIPTGLEVFGDGVGGYGSQLTSYPYDTTVLMQKSGVNDDAIVFDCPLESGYYRLFHINMHDFVLLKQGTSDTVGNGISARQVGTDRTATANHCLVNGVSVFERLLVRGFPENGMYFKQGAVPLYCNELDFIFNKGYGLRIDGTNYARNIILRNIAGDGNKGRAVVYVSCSTDDSQLTIDGVYSEYRSDNPYGNSSGFNGAQPYAVELGTFGANSNVHITNVTQESIVVDEAAAACIFLTSATQAGTPNVTFSGCTIGDLSASTGQKKVLLDNRAWDSFQSVSIPAGVTSGAYALNGSGTVPPVQFNTGFVSFGTGFRKPLSGTEGIQTYGPTPTYSWFESDAAADAKGWSFGPSGGALYLRIFNDAGSAGDIGLTVVRAGNTFSYFDFAKDVRTAGKFRATGMPTYADNTAATSGGLAVGDFYKTATGDLKVRY